MWHQWFNHNFMKLHEYFLCAKKTKIMTLLCLHDTCVRCCWCRSRRTGVEMRRGLFASREMHTHASFSWTCVEIFLLQVFELFYRDVFHRSHTRVIHIASAMLYQASHRASVLHQKSHTHMELVMWHKYDSVAVCKSCTVVKMFWGH